MYNSLIPWLNIPVTIKPFEKRDGTGAITYGAERTELCYPAALPQIVKDDSGEEVISSTTLYFKGETVVDIMDKIIFEGEEYDIISINNHYREGKVDCRTVKI
jgi:hypothetical protein